MSAPTRRRLLQGLVGLSGLTLLPDLRKRIAAIAIALLVMFLHCAVRTLRGALQELHAAVPQS